MGEDVTITKIEKLLENSGIDGYEIVPLQAGFNRKSYSINDEYVLKICVDNQNESKIMNEVNFYKENSNNGYYPKLISYDSSKSIIPYIYTIEEKLKGKILFDVWAKLSNSERIDILNQLLTILKSIHKPLENLDNYAISVVKSYNECLNKCVESNIFDNNELNYLKSLEEIMQSSFKDVKMGYIHGDVHFNNIIVDSLNIKLIDFECYKKAPIDLEFDSLNRMTRNPNSFVKNASSEKYYDPSDYLMVMDFFKQSYSDVCQQEGFSDRIIIYDCLNSIRWISKYPNYQLYRDVLLNDSKKLSLKS